MLPSKTEIDMVHFAWSKNMQREALSNIQSRVQGMSRFGCVNTSAQKRD